MDSPGFITKVLLPRRRTDVLRRPRLIEFLHQHIDRRLILVCAPAGYGKTTLLVDFAQDAAIPFCWYTPGAADADPRVFLEYLIAAIRQRFPEFGRQTEAAMRGMVDVNRELSAIIGVLVSEIHNAIPEYFVLVLDDFHAVDASDQVKTALDLLLYYLPENCHIIIASRSIPRLTLSRLAAHRQVAGLGNSDLRFTADEIKQLLSENYKVLLPAKTAEALATESEGWITGIILSTHTMWQGLFETLIKAKGATGEVFEYLASEVFAQQPEDIRRFLLGTSVLEQMTPEICGRLLDDEGAAARLLYLEDANLFVTRLEGSEGWRRYHQLFKTFLESKLRYEQPEWHAEVQRRAAELAAARSDWDQAIGHYVRAGGYEEACAIILERSNEMIDTGKLPTLARWIDDLPAEAAGSSPELLLARGRICYRLGEPERGIELLSHARDLFAERDDSLSTARVLAGRSIALAIRGRYGEAIEDCQRAVSLAGESDASLAAEAQRNLGICHGMQGHFPESITALTEALRLQRDAGDQYAVATLHQSLGLANARLGDVPRARFHFEQALAACRRLGNVVVWGETLNSLGVLLFDDGEYEAALETLSEALAKAREANHLRLEAAVLADLGHLFRAQRRYPEAIESYERSLDIARRTEDGFLVGSALNGLGDTYARMGDHRRADRFIREAILQAEERQSPYEQGTYEISLGMLRCDQGQPAKGLRNLTKACELLAECSAKRELTRARLGTARAMHMMGRKSEALAQVNAALALGSEIDYEQFLVLDGKRCAAVLAFAREQGVRDGRVGVALSAQYTEMETPPQPEAPTLQAIAAPIPVALKAYALGQARALREGKEITRGCWASDKVRELFFFLLDHPYLLTKEQIVESVWPDLPARSYNSTFHPTLFRLRRALQDDYITTQREGRYRFRADVQCFYDVAEFERLIDEAERQPRDSGEIAALYRRALALYQGPFLKEFTSEWCEARRRHLAARRLAALAKLASAVAANGAYGESIELCHEVLAEDNFREEIHGVLLNSYLATGDHAAALRHYRRYATFLRDEMGTAPSARLHGIYEQILRGGLAPSEQR